jgi:hypothetical protein
MPPGFKEGIRGVPNELSKSEPNENTARQIDGILY